MINAIFFAISSTGLKLILSYVGFYKERCQYQDYYCDLSLLIKHIPTFIDKLNFYFWGSVLPVPKIYDD